MLNRSDEIITLPTPLKNWFNQHILVPNNSQLTSEFMFDGEVDGGKEYACFGDFLNPAVEKQLKAYRISYKNKLVDRTKQVKVCVSDIRTAYLTFQILSEELKAEEKRSEEKNGPAVDVSPKENNSDKNKKKKKNHRKKKPVGEQKDSSSEPASVARLSPSAAGKEVVEQGRNLPSAQEKKDANIHIKFGSYIKGKVPHITSVRIPKERIIKMIESGEDCLVLVDNSKRFAIIPNAWLHPLANAYDFTMKHPLPVWLEDKDFKTDLQNYLPKLLEEAIGRKIDSSIVTLANGVYENQLGSWFTFSIKLTKKQHQNLIAKLNQLDIKFSHADGLWALNLKNIYIFFLWSQDNHPEKIKREMEACANRDKIKAEEERQEIKRHKKKMRATKEESKFHEAECPLSEDDNEEEKAPVQVASAKKSCPIAHEPNNANVADLLKSGEWKRTNETKKSGSQKHVASKVPLAMETAEPASTNGAIPIAIAIPVASNPVNLPHSASVPTKSEPVVNAKGSGVPAKSKSVRVAPKHKASAKNNDQVRVKAAAPKEGYVVRNTVPVKDVQVSLPGKNGMATVVVKTSQFSSAAATVITPIQAAPAAKTVDTKLSQHIASTLAYEKFPLAEIEPGAGADIEPGVMPEPTTGAISPRQTSAQITFFSSALSSESKREAVQALQFSLVPKTEIDVLKGPRQRHEGESAEDYVEYLESYTAQFKNHHGILLHKTPAKK